MSADKLLAHLEAVRQTGPGRWIAKCPGHKDQGPSLSVRELDDGRTLLHCFAGCAALDVLDGVGLRLADLFPQPLGQPLPSTRSRIPPSDLLELISHQAMIALVVASDFLRTREITEDQFRELQVAVHRIGAAVEHARG